jgi:Zn-finger nucleic acid-binding protein
LDKLMQGEREFRAEFDRRYDGGPQQREYGHEKLAHRPDKQAYDRHVYDNHGYGQHDPYKHKKKKTMFDVFGDLFE